MRKLASILVLVFAFTLTTQAQKKRKDKRPKLSVEQRTNLAIKKMTLALDLDTKQQKQIAPLLKAQAEGRAAAMKKRMEMRKAEKKPTADEMYEMQAQRLDNQIAFKNSMQDILDKEQFQKFQKMAKSRKMKGKKMMKKKAEMKKGQGKKRRMKRNNDN